MIDPSQKRSFRTREVAQIMDAVQAGDSCLLVGIGSVGKSNLLRFLQQDDVRQDRLGSDWQQYLFIYVDNNKLLEKTTFGLLELMLHQLLVSAGESGAEEAGLQALDNLHQRATQPATQHLVLRYLDRAAAFAIRKLNLHLVFMFDEFDDLVRSLPAQAFAFLRALRDDYKYRLMYIAAARAGLHQLRSDPSEIEPFDELVSEHTIWLMAYSPEDSQAMIDRLAVRYQVKIEALDRERMLSASGGHPGLLRTAFYLWKQSPGGFTGFLGHMDPFKDECMRIWRSLPLDERQVLSRLADNDRLLLRSGPVLEKLRRKGLAVPSGSGDAIFSPVFAAFIHQEHPPVTHITLDAKKHILYIDEYKIDGLSRLEFSMMEYLVEHRGQVCKKDDLLVHLYPEDAEKGASDTRLDTMVKRVRRLVEENPEDPQFIVTVHGIGIKLNDGSQDD